MVRVHWCPYRRRSRKKSRKREAEELHLFKSRDPHLAGNKNKAFRPFRKPQAGKKSWRLSTLPTNTGTQGTDLYPILTTLINPIPYFWANSSCFDKKWASNVRPGSVGALVNRKVIVTESVLPSAKIYSVCIYIYIYIRMYVCMCMCVCVYVCMHVCMYVYKYIYTYMRVKMYKYIYSNCMYRHMEKN